MPLALSFDCPFRGTYFSDSQPLPDNRLRKSAQAIIRKWLIYNHMGATAFSTAWFLRRLFVRGVDDGAALSVSQTKSTSFP
jgi:hypothetical protein